MHRNMIIWYFQSSEWERDRSKVRIAFQKEGVYHTMCLTFIIQFKSPGKKLSLPAGDSGKPQKALRRDMPSSLYRVRIDLE